nr:MAG TPA: hypothetical protein [Caudoviricetes sp.]
MDTKQLQKTIEEQNQVIIAKDAYIRDLQSDLKQTKDKLSDARWDISWQKFNKEWANAAIQQKAVHVIGGFEYNTRYVSLETTITLMLMSVALTVFILVCGK